MSHAGHIKFVPGVQCRFVAEWKNPLAASVSRWWSRASWWLAQILILHDTRVQAFLFCQHQDNWVRSIGSAKNGTEQRARLFMQGRDQMTLDSVWKGFAGPQYVCPSRVWRSDSLFASLLQTVTYLQLSVWSICMLVCPMGNKDISILWSILHMTKDSKHTSLYQFWFCPGQVFTSTESVGSHVALGTVG